MISCTIAIEEAVVRSDAVFVMFISPICLTNASNAAALLQNRVHERPARSRQTAGYP